MAETLEEIPEDEELAGDAPPRERRWPKAVGIGGGVLIAVFTGLWLTRDTIVDNLIGKQLAEMNLPATYRIESTGLPRQVLTNIVIGDPAHPDMTIERAEVIIEPRFGFPVIGEVRIVRPRLYGTYRQGQLSFGSLDKLLFGKKSAEPFRLPDLNLTVEDGRGRILSDHGAVGFKLAGRGNLKDGFAGEAAAVAPQLALGNCHSGPASLYGHLTVTGGRPGLEGPLRFAALDCGKGGLNVREGAVQIKARLDDTLDGADLGAVLSIGPLSYGQARSSAVSGKIDLAYRKSALVARYGLKADKPGLPDVSAGAVTLDGTLRTSGGLARFDAEGTARGENLATGRAINGALVSAQKATDGTLGAPLLAQFRRALAKHLAGSRAEADYVLHGNEEGARLVVPKASVTGGSGETVLALSRFEMDRPDAGLPRLTGNFTTGGAGLPRITGRVDRKPRGDTVIRMTMAPYRAGGARLALPRFALTQSAGSRFTFAGDAEASGAIPGGGVEGLVLPLDGRWQVGRSLELWRGCREARFAGLTYGGLKLARNALQFCPTGGTAVLRSGGRRTVLAARLPSVDLTGSLGSNPLHLTSGPVVLAANGGMTAEQLALALGVGSDPTRLSFASLTREPGGGLHGQFAGAQGAIHGIPLEMQDGTGLWRLESGHLAITGLGLRLLDGVQVDRFKPLIAHDATVDYAGDQIQAEAILREPTSDREIAHIRIAHDFAKASGSALLDVPGITFDAKLQPEMITPLSLGVLANVRGSVTGDGRIDWVGDKVTSTGKVTTPGLDFAAAFGPTEGVSGTVVFTDLIGLVTAPDQRLDVASINPGIEANGGKVSFELQRDGVLLVNGAEWPFLDGKMTLLPTRMKLGAAEVRSYVLEVKGVSATRFVEKLELGNLSATGIFDGKLPLIFDQNGGRIEGGKLISRPPGGNLSYVGSLTYTDLSAMANFAFQTLRSLDYRRMEVSLDGDLGGEIVTKVRFDGVRQGKGAKRNFVTRQLGNLPIQMNVNVRAPFFALISSFRNMYDPSVLSAQVRDKIEAEMEKADKAGGNQTPKAKPSPAQRAIQAPASGSKP